MSVHIQSARLTLLALCLLRIVCSDVAIAAEAAEPAIMIGVRAMADGSLQYRYDGKIVDATDFQRLCKEGQRKRLNLRAEEPLHWDGKTAITAIVWEAICLGETHIGFTGIDRYPEPKVSAHKRATPPGTAASPP